MLSKLHLQIAREAIQARYDGSVMKKDSLLRLHPELGIKKATFVTLTLDGQLRGCIGSLIAHRPFIDDLISNAQSAAFRDPRFPPLSAEEFQKIKIEISLLSEPQALLYTDKRELKEQIRTGIDGVVIRLRNYQATFLPQVWEELSDFETFFAHLGVKAGIGSDPLSSHPEVYTYQVEKIKEE
ncbi:MAG: AmmeMemoRadiSam system protein A [Campylobacterales bacterium]|nr:AmmeMemoRadiSam system protein A [Campylobacterales bacterium]